MRALLLIIAITGAIGCNTQKRCARFVQKHPDCFKSTKSTRIDTITREMTAWDTIIKETRDTLKVPTPCGDITITRQTDGSTKVHQKPKVMEIKETTTETIQLPAPCDCNEKDRIIKQLRKEAKQKRPGTPWWLVFAAIGVGMVIGWLK